MFGACTYICAAIFGSYPSSLSICQTSFEGPASQLLVLRECSLSAILSGQHNMWTDNAQKCLLFCLMTDRYNFLCT